MVAMLLPLTAFADDPVPVEVWVCDYKEGKTLADLEHWYDDFNQLSDKMDNPDLTMGDGLGVTSFPDLESMGQSMMEFFGGDETGALFARYQNIVDCTGRDLWMVQQMRDRG